MAELKTKERPILMSAPMARALLAGNKTQTRRVIKPQPYVQHFDGFIGWHWPKKSVYLMGYSSEEALLSDMPKFCPYGQLGDQLWVRETWATAPLAIHYRADNNFRSFHGEPRLDDFVSTKGWRPSIFMPRWASRITLEVTGVKAERLQNISKEDAVMEGIDWTTEYHSLGTYDHGRSTAIRAFQDLWDSINAKHGFGWDTNPWAWVVEFRRLE